MKICDVLINGNIDKLLTYKVPDNISQEIQVGYVISVPLNNRKVTGIVVNVKNISKIENLKEINRIILDIPVLNKNSFNVIEHTSNYFLQNIGKFSSKLIPKSGPRYSIEYRFLESEGATKRERQILSLIRGSINKKELLGHTTHRTIANMVKHGLIEETRSLLPCANNIPKTEYTDFHNVKKNNSKIVEKGIIFVEKSPESYDYIKRVISKNIARNKTTLLILPQLMSHQFLVDFIRSEFKNNLCIYSSALSDKEKNISFYNIISGKTKIIIGTGDALFLPYMEIGDLLFLMPESPQHFHYTSMPYYNAEIVAGFFSKSYSVPLHIIGKTPSINLIPSMGKNNTKIIKYKTEKSKTVFLKSRNPFNIITKQIISEIRKNLSNGNNILMIHNQLGYYPFVKCNDCNDFITCPVCNSPLVYTGKNNLYYCQKCKKYFMIKKCPRCGSNNLNFSGTGIEKVSSVLSDEFGKENIKTISANEPFTTAGLNDKKIVLSTSIIFKDLFPNRFDTIVIPSLETILNDYVVRSEWNFIRIIEYLKSFLNNNGKIILQSPLYYDFIPFLNTDKIEQYVSYTLKLRKQLKLPPYFHVISIRPTRESLSVDRLFEKIREKSGDSIIKTGDSIVIKTKRISNFYFLKTFQQKDGFRIFVDSEEYL